MFIVRVFPIDDAGDNLHSVYLKKYLVLLQGDFYLLAFGSDYPNNLLQRASRDDEALIFGKKIALVASGSSERNDFFGQAETIRRRQVDLILIKENVDSCQIEAGIIQTDTKQQSGKGAFQFLGWKKIRVFLFILGNDGKIFPIHAFYFHLGSGTLYFQALFIAFEL